MHSFCLDNVVYNRQAKQKLLDCELIMLCVHNGMIITQVIKTFFTRKLVVYRI